jgi:hypothetical protein
MHHCGLSGRNCLGVPRQTSRQLCRVAFSSGKSGKSSAARWRSINLSRSSSLRTIEDAWAVAETSILFG